MKNRTGAVLAEWIIVFPLVLFLLLSIAQLGFIMNAKQTVTYAAYSAARVLLVKGDGKKAAALACIGITGLENITPYPPTTDPDIIHIAGRYSRDERSHADFLERFSAAVDKTDLRIIDLQETDDNVKVTLEVSHDYELDFPLVNQFIAILFSESSRYGSPHITLRSAVSLG